MLLLIVMFYILFTQQGLLSLSHARARAHRHTRTCTPETVSQQRCLCRRVYCVEIRFRALKVNTLLFWCSGDSDVETAVLHTLVSKSLWNCYSVGMIRVCCSRRYSGVVLRKRVYAVLTRSSRNNLWQTLQEILSLRYKWLSQRRFLKIKLK